MARSAALFPFALVTYAWFRYAWPGASLCVDSIARPFFIAFRCSIRGRLANFETRTQEELLWHPLAGIGPKG